MQRYLDPNYAGPPFDLFGSGHLLALSIIAAVIAFLIWGWRDPDEETRRRARFVLAGVILVVESSWHVWNMAYDTWDVQRHLPLHSCSIGIWLCIPLLITRNYRLYEVLYFMGIGGALQALLTPAVGPYGLPHFWPVQSLASHGLLVIALVYMTTIEGLRPTWMSIWRTLLIVNVYMFAVTGVNYLIGSNYMYTMRKPATASLFDVMGPWPWYLVVAELLAVLFFAILYLPFARADRRPVVSRD